MSLISKWNEMEMGQCHFLSDEIHEKKDPVFYDWFCMNYSNIFPESVIQCVRETAGLEKPPTSFCNNCSESINKPIKQHVHHQKKSLPVFVKQLHTLLQLSSAIRRRRQACKLKIRDYVISKRYKKLLSCHVPTIQYWSLA